MSENPKSRLSVVVIGLNEAARLNDCLTAVMAARPAPYPLEVFYVDSGSSDDSVAIAKSVPEVTVLSLCTEHPSAAKARNVGLRHASGSYVQLIDGDSVIQPGWLEIGLRLLEQSPDVACVFGHCTEMFPTQSLYTEVCGLDWHTTPGEQRYCGGNALWRRSVLESHRWFDETLRLGEEPDLCYRVRQKGYRIVCIDHPMVRHDLAIARFTEYWRRGEASGEAYARVAKRHWRNRERLWLREFVRNSCEPLMWVLLVLAGAWWGGVAGALGLLVAVVTVRALGVARTVACRARHSGLAILYGLHCQFVRLPLATGQLKGFWRHW